MANRILDLLAKGWRYLLRLLERPLAAPGLAWAIFARRAHAGELLHLAPHRGWLRRSGIATVIDAGAHRGEFASAISALLPGVTIYCYEPQPRCQRHLRAHSARLGIAAVFGVALGERSGTAALYRNTFSKSSSLLPLGDVHRQAFPWARQLEPEPVQIERLDGFADRLELRGGVLLKIDVQGYELALLRGAQRLLPRIDAVLVETSLRSLYRGDASFSEVSSLLIASGFRYAGALDQLVSPLDGEILQQDALFVRGDGVGGA